MRAARLTAAAALSLALAGCSQTAALAPVGGDRLAEVRFAALDVLTDQQVSVLVAPVCTASGADAAAITCTGRTTDDKAITVTSTAADQDTIDVAVDGTSIFTGAVTDVLQSAAEAP